MRSSIAILVSMFAAFASAFPAGAARMSANADWQSYTHPTLHFSIMFPGAVFTPDPKANLANGLALVSEDGAARFLIGAFDNDEATTLRDYREFVLDRSYRGADVDYAPVRKNWFVVSGERDGRIFYERVDFTCKGRRITSWAMVYPVAQRAFYDRLVESVAPTFRPSGGESC